MTALVHSRAERGVALFAMFPCFAVLYLMIASFLPPPSWLPTCPSRYPCASQGHSLLGGTKVLFSGCTDPGDAARYCGEAAAHVLSND